MVYCDLFYLPWSTALDCSSVRPSSYWSYVLDYYFYHTNRIPSNIRLVFRAENAAGAPYPFTLTPLPLLARSWLTKAL